MANGCKAFEVLSNFVVPILAIVKCFCLNSMVKRICNHGCFIIVFHSFRVVKIIQVLNNYKGKNLGAFQ